MNRDKFRKHLEAVYGKVEDEKFEIVYRNTEIILKDKEVRGIQVIHDDDREKVLH